MHLQRKKILEIEQMKANKRQEFVLGVYNNEDDTLERKINRERYKVLAKQMVKFAKLKEIEAEYERDQSLKEQKVKCKEAERTLKKLRAQSLGMMPSDAKEQYKVISAHEAELEELKKIKDEPIIVY